jgi:hypothetical protein
MWVKKQLYPHPWETPATKLVVKDNHYFHTKHDLLNSPFHTSAKQAQFYQPELYTYTPSPQPSVNSYAEISHLQSKSRLMRRKAERERDSSELQLRTSQRRTDVKVSRSATPSMSLSIKTRFDDPADQRTVSVVTSRQNSWNRLNSLPQHSLKKVVNEFILQKDRGIARQRLSSTFKPSLTRRRHNKLKSKTG